MLAGSGKRVDEGCTEGVGVVNVPPEKKFWDNALGLWKAETADSAGDTEKKEGPKTFVAPKTLGWDTKPAKALPVAGVTVEETVGTDDDDFSVIFDDNHGGGVGFRGAGVGFRGAGAMVCVRESSLPKFDPLFTEISPSISTAWEWISSK